MVEDVQLLTYSNCSLPGLAGIHGCRDDEGGVEIQCNLQAKRAGSPHFVKSSKLGDSCNVMQCIMMP